ncbi:MAG: hypothetical protein KDB02_00270 [Acidimicrobiales bacterium]|nr:hypothetical protein [Acidimicrobiales bacterium]
MGFRLGRAPDELVVVRCRSHHVEIRLDGEERSDPFTHEQVVVREEDSDPEIEGFEVTAADVHHKGGRTFGYRVEADGRSFAYLPDHRLCEGSELAVGSRRLCEGVDVLVHDAQFTEPERALAEAYGHSTIAEAIGFARDCDVGSLVLFHHSPVRTDGEMERIADDVAAATLPVTVAGEGLTLVV